MNTQNDSDFSTLIQQVARLAGAMERIAAALEHPELPKPDEQGIGERELRVTTLKIVDHILGDNSGWVRAEGVYELMIPEEAPTSAAIRRVLREMCLDRERDKDGWLYYFANDRQERINQLQHEMRSLS